jgi:hypothetical protein
VVLRGAGIDTVRLGPKPISRGVGMETLSLEDLGTSMAIYTEIIRRYCR